MGIDDSMAQDECDGCGGGDLVPGGVYWVCPVCDSEWPADED